MDKINFIDLKSQYQRMKNDVDEAIMNVLDSTMYIQGPEVKTLEKSLSEYIGAKHCISCSSGTDALLLSLMSLDLKSGDEVITSPFTFFASSEVIAFLGAKPVFVDIDPLTYNINPNLIESKITNKTKAIMPVSLYGQCSDMDEINALSLKYNLTVVEDACQSFGAEYKGKKSCNLSEIGCTSFFPSKPLGCYGDGGAIFTNNDTIAEKLRILMNHGQAERYSHRYIGINGRLDAIQAAILNVKLKYLPEEVKQRADIGARYSMLLNDKAKDRIMTPIIKSDRTSVYAQYSIRVKNRSEVIDRLNSVGIPTAVHYPIPLYRQEAFAYLNESPLNYPITEMVCAEILSLPMSPYLTKEQQDYIINEIIQM